MAYAKKKKLGGIDYVVIGSTIEREGFSVVSKKYTTTKGRVVIEGGRVTHPDGSVTYE